MKVYGHTWLSTESPQSSTLLDTCNSVYVLDTSVIGEDEYLAVVDGWAAKESKVYCNVSSIYAGQDCDCCSSILIIMNFLCCIMISLYYNFYSKAVHYV